ncbi:hypothetical protein CDS [Bradyrhizobium sp.]|nr:hypothetical protein CDS [Bradyrhizobium sp.]
MRRYLREHEAACRDTGQRRADSQPLHAKSHTKSCAKSLDDPEIIAPDDSSFVAIPLVQRHSMPKLRHNVPDERRASLRPQDCVEFA